MRFVFCILSLLLCLSTKAAPGQSVDQTKPNSPAFKAGDHFVYDLYWSFIKVGKAELAFDLTSLEPDGPDYLHASFTVKTQGIADKLFKVRDVIETWIDPITYRPQLYKKKQREGKTERDVVVTYDWDNNTATYSNRGVAKEPVNITDDTFDPLSMLVFLASQKYSTDTKINQAVTDGKKLVFIEASLKEKDSIKLDTGRYTANRLEVATNELSGVFEKSPDASIEVWFDSQQPAIPLKMKSKVAVGSFYGELTEFKSASDR